MFPVTPLHDGVFIDIIDRNVTTKDLGNGKVLHLLSDDSFTGPHNPVVGKHPGARPRQARVLAIGPEVFEVSPGDLVLCDTLKWSRKIPLGRAGLEVVYFWRIAEKDILLVDSSDAAEYLADFERKISRVSLTIGRI